MKIYLAPMEGLTGYVFRQTLAEHFGGVDKYFTPFITPAAKGSLGHKILQDILPQNNPGQVLVPQILTDNAEGFIEMCNRLSTFGYSHFNLNLGCPSGTVVAKGRGAGFLAYPEQLNRFLEDIFKTDYKISIKTRLGMTDPQQFNRLLAIYNQYPLEELIIHPRTRADMYKNPVNREMYAYAVANTGHSLCYNGDIFDLQCLEQLKPFIGSSNIMLGRGLVINPMLALETKQGKCRSSSKIQAFYKELLYRYSLVMPGQVPLLHKMKEALTYALMAYEPEPKVAKAIKKAKTREELALAMDALFTNCKLKEKVEGITL